MDYLTSSWQFLKRHKGKLASGATVIGGIYAAKKVVESELFTDLVDRVEKAAGFSVYESPSCNSALEESRRHFIFDAHQQSCDKALQYSITELRETIKQRFNTEELVERLRSNELLANEKIELWEKLKVRAFARVVALAYCHPLLIIAFKLHTSVLSCNISGDSMQKQKSNRPFEITSYVSSFMNMFSNQEPVEVADVMVQQKFNNCIRYLATDGIDCLLNIVKQVVNEFISRTKLTDEIGKDDICDLFTKIGNKLNTLTGCNNFSDFIIPVQQQLANNDSPTLRKLLDQYAFSLKAQRSKSLMNNFKQQYIDAIINVVQENVGDQKAISIAKLVPLLSKAFSKVSTNKYGSLFHTILNDTELYQFTLLVFTCADDLTNIS